MRRKLNSVLIALGDLGPVLKANGLFITLCLLANSNSISEDRMSLGKQLVSCPLLPACKFQMEH